MLGCRTTDTPIEVKGRQKEKLVGDLVDKRRYQQLVGRLVYLSHTRPNFTFGVSLVCQYMTHLQKNILRLFIKF